MGGRGSSSSSARSGPLESLEEFYSRHPEFMRDGYAITGEIPQADKERLVSNGLNGSMTQLYVDENNLYGKARVVDSDGYRQALEAGAIEVYRGMPDSDRATGKEKLENMMYDGKYYVGDGVYGDGTYFAVNPGVAANYSMGDARRGAMVQAAISKDARVIKYSDLRNMKMDLEDKLHHGIRNGDESIIALAAGYDVVLQDTGQGLYYNVLNRNVLTVNKDIGYSRSMRVKGEDRINVRANDWYEKG